MRFAYAALAFLLLGHGWAQSFFYEPLTLAPAEVNFLVTAEDLICAALLSPDGASSGGVIVDGLSLPPNCPSSPPVVVWGVDPESGDAVYATLIRVKFWGERFYWNRRSGVDALVRLLKSDYGVDMVAAGDVGSVDVQLLPPLTQPPVDQPSDVTAGWASWQVYQSVSMDDPQISDEANYPGTCPLEDQLGSTCWSAVLTWALPIRLVVHGGELGNFKVTVTAEGFSQKTASTLNVSGGELVRPTVQPYEK
ncbi:hypothetical protein [Oceanithermus sp.]